jgi:hypothetical protein
MIMATHTPHIIEGTWEEIALHARELRGKRMKVMVLPDEVGSTTPAARRPNEAALEAMPQADQIQEGMNPKPGSDSVTLIREGRAGAMWGYEPRE